jgi:hypothetical protein
LHGQGEKQPTGPESHASGEGAGPAPTDTQVEEPGVAEIDLFFDGQCPEHTTDCVGKTAVEVVNEQQVGSKVDSLVRAPVEAIGAPVEQTIEKDSHSVGGP